MSIHKAPITVDQLLTVFTPNFLDQMAKLSRQGSVREGGAEAFKKKVLEVATTTDKMYAGEHTDIVLFSCIEIIMKAVKLTGSIQNWRQN